MNKQDLFMVIITVFVIIVSVVILMISYKSQRFYDSFKKDMQEMLDGKVVG